MKKLSFLSLIFISSLIFYTCQKEEVEPQITPITKEIEEPQIVLPRTGFTDRIFFKSSLTTDNVLLSGQANYLRTYNIYNKTKIDSIRFQSTGRGVISYNGVLLKHYNVTIYFKNTPTPTTFTAFSKTNQDSFKFVPILSNQLLTTTNTSKIVTLEVQTSGAMRHNIWSGTNVNLRNVKIFKDGVLMETRVLDPLDKSSNIFILPHSH